jgi:hypothetical protein
MCVSVSVQLHIKLEFTHTKELAIMLRDLQLQEIAFMIVHV